MIGLEPRSRRFKSFHTDFYEVRDLAICPYNDNGIRHIMISLFQKMNFASHSGKELDWKLECDTLTDGDWECIAYLISKKYVFNKVIGVPAGGLKLAAALERYKDEDSEIETLVVDDVLTTGNSIKEIMSKHYESYGIVLFARGFCPDDVFPIFQLSKDYMNR